MRILKKSLSLLLALTMIASLVVVNVSAADEDILVSVDYSKAAIGQGQDIEVTISVTAQKGAAIATSFPAMTVKWNPALASFKEETTDATMGFRTGDGETLSYDNSEGYMDLGAAGLEVPTTKTAVFRCLFTVAADADVAQNFTVTVDEDVTGFANASGDSVPYAVSNSEVDILKAFTVETVTNATSETKSYALGEKTLAQVEAELNEIDFAVEGAADGEAANLNATTWTSEPAYDQNTPGTYVFTGNLVGTDVVTVPDAKKAVTVTVTVTPLTAGEITADIASVIEIPAEKVEREVTDEELLALVEGAVYTITSGDFTDTIEGTAAVTENAIDITDVETTATITVTFAAETASTAGKFVLAEADTLTFTVDVVPAEIEGCTIEIKNTTANAKPTVKATIPANEVVGEAAVSVEFLKPVTVEETTTWEVVDTFEATATAVADEATVVEVKADATLDEMGFKNAGDVFAVKVLVNGATLLVDGAEQVESKVMLTFADGGSVGGIGVSQGNVSVVVPSKPDEPGTDEPGTEEPGTDEPGTDVPAVEGPFAVVAADHWAASFIAALKDAGIIGGVNDTDFAPDNNITRAEYAKMIAGAFGLEATSAEVAFADCTADDWFTPFVAACVEAGYINGVSETEFAPNENITREQACAILGRALNVAGEGELTFTDAAEVEEYAKAFVAALAEMGIVNGYEDGTFAPKNNITRAEAAKIIAGVLAAQTEEAPAAE